MNVPAFLRRVPGLESVAGDVRFALRHFSRRPLLTSTMVMVLAIGIGVHSALFTGIRAYTTRPAPGVPNDASLVAIRGKEQAAEQRTWFPRAFSYPELRELAAQRDVFAAVAGWTNDLAMLDTGDPEHASSARVQFVTGNFFSLLRLQPSLGQFLPPDQRSDSGAAELVAVISEALWRETFGGAADVVGTSIRLNETNVRIVGVAPPRFNGATSTSGSRMIWLPLSVRTVVLNGGAHALFSRDSTFLSAIGRLRPDVSLERANVAVRRVDAIAVTRTAVRSEAIRRDADVVPLRGSIELPERDDIAIVAALAGIGALLILLVACTNVSALTIGAAVSRRQEIAVRLSLGASRLRIVRQLLTESCLVALAGGSLGLLLYWWITEIVSKRITDVTLSPDLRTIIFTITFALGTGILFGLSPALHATRQGVAAALKDTSAGATRRSRLQSAFIVAQIVVTQPLLVGIAMMLALVTQQGPKPQDDVARHVIRVRFYLEGMSQASVAGLRDAIHAIAQSPGVSAVVSEASGLARVDLMADSADASGALPSFDAHLEQSSPGYFALLDVPIVRGRDVIAMDSLERDLAIVIGDDLAREIWHGADPIGRRLVQAVDGTRSERRLRVVGVYDARYATTRGAGRRVYSMSTTPWRDASVLVRTSGPAEAYVKTLRSELRARVPYAAISRIETLAEVDRNNRAEALQVSSLAGAGGFVALLLASIGLYGVVSLAVAQRRREIGIRVALGARPRQATALVFESGMRLAIAGLVLGLPLSVAALGVLASAASVPTGNLLLVGTVIVVTVLVVASLATWIPARRAARVDPISVLRAE